MDDIERCLEVGRPAVLSITAWRGGERSARAIIRGWQRGSYVLLDIPDESGLGVGPRVGDPCKLRFLADGDACGLDATMIDLGSGSHFSYVKVAWPHAVTMTRVRKHQRVHVHIPCKVQVETGLPLEGEIHDMSAGGCRVALDRPLPQHTNVTIEFVLPGNASPIAAKAETCAVGAFPGGAWLGCKFVDIADDVRYAIDFFVATSAANLRIGSQLSNRILLIYPDLAQAAPLKQALASQGYDVTSAPNLIDGFFWLRASSPSLLLMHAEPMPFRGLDAVKSIRAIPAFENLPIILFGGSQNDRNEAMHAGVTQYLPSSAQVQELVTAVTSALAVST
ncbi:MAG: PilZ domain-containing protein [Candidatus Hydrogenedentes bacterium]|nr:PilZ domain-containing protein [Candidatus Hydrogenedentota bacterium]